MAVYRGQCHCGAIGFRFQAEEPPSRWAIRACQCSFCTAHGAACVSDPSGSVSFTHARESELQRYRFGLRTADFLLCRNCGVYIGALLTDAEGAFATLNTRAMNRLSRGTPVPQPVVYDQETAVDRRNRRIRSWTPVEQDFQ